MDEALEGEEDVDIDTARLNLVKYMMNCLLISKKTVLPLVIAALPRKCIMMPEQKRTLILKKRTLVAQNWTLMNSDKKGVRL